MDSPILWLILIGLPLVWVLLAYNGLVNGRNQVAFAFATIDVQLKKRFDLVPNLVETVKGYAAHEREAMEAVTLARQEVAKPEAGWGDERNLQDAVGRLVARAEAYPDLKADGHFMLLQRQLTECEAQIAAARRAYNASVMDYNNRVEMVPSSLVAGMFNFRKMSEFEIAIAERGVPDVRF
ncbi:MAG: LemA family protein [Luteolibacter sp.]